jgi:hypothetical protein
VKTRWRATLCLAIIVLLGAFLRCRQASESLWLDELHTSWVVSGEWSDIAPRAQAGNQSPLYFYLVWAIVQAAGQSEWTLRLLSLTAGTMLIGGVAWLVRQWSGGTASALIAALILALQRDCIFFAQEARPYALVQLSALLHCIVFVAVLQRPTARNRLLFVGGAVWLFYLHYTAFLLLVAQGVFFAAVRGRSQARVAYTLCQAAMDAAWIALLLLPSASHVLSIAERRDNWEQFVEAWPPPAALQNALIIYGILPMAAALAAHWMRCKGGNFTLRSLPGMWTAVWFLLPILLAWLATLTRLAPLCMVRYLVASLVGAVTFAALCLALYRHRIYTVTLASILGLLTVATSGMVEQYQHDGRLIGDRNEQWDTATHWLNNRLREESAPVLLCAGLLEDAELTDHADPDVVEYCLFALTGIYRVDAEHLVPLPTATPVTLSSVQREMLKRHGAAWLVIRAGPRTTQRITESLVRELNREGGAYNWLEQRRFGNVAILRIGTEAK